MVFRINVGESNFEFFRKEGSYYVDKTNLIYELVNNSVGILKFLISCFAKFTKFCLLSAESLSVIHFTIVCENKNVVIETANNTMPGTTSNDPNHKPDNIVGARKYTFSHNGAYLFNIEPIFAFFNGTKTERENFGFTVKEVSIIFSTTPG